MLKIKLPRHECKLGAQYQINGFYDEKSIIMLMKHYKNPEREGDRWLWSIVAYSRPNSSLQAVPDDSATCEVMNFCDSHNGPDDKKDRISRFRRESKTFMECKGIGRLIPVGYSLLDPLTLIKLLANICENRFGNILTGRANAPTNDTSFLFPINETLTGDLECSEAFCILGTKVFQTYCEIRLFGSVDRIQAKRYDQVAAYDLLRYLCIYQPYVQGKSEAIPSFAEFRILHAFFMDYLKQPDWLHWTLQDLQDHYWKMLQENFSEEKLAGITDPEHPCLKCFRHLEHRSLIFLYDHNELKARGLWIRLNGMCEYTNARDSYEISQIRLRKDKL